VAFYLLFLGFWLVALAPLALGAIFYIATVVALAQVVWHWWLIRTRTREGCFRAFRMNHWVGFTLFAGIVGGSLVR
jgi:4-hydroxybenzoate polyprenyltransferase